MSSHARQILLAGAFRKRKEREEREVAKLIPAPRKRAEPDNSNQLLAGYMAYEFLTKGTLLGQKWDPARAETGILTTGLNEPSKNKQNGSREAEPSEKRESYAEVAGLLKGDGAHVAGVVNPTQLARWMLDK